MISRICRRRKSEAFVLRRSRFLWKSDEAKGGRNCPKRCTIVILASVLYAVLVLLEHIALKWDLDRVEWNLSSLVLNKDAPVLQSYSVIKLCSFKCTRVLQSYAV
jgi:hypothetical protein